MLHEFSFCFGIQKLSGAMTPSQAQPSGSHVNSVLYKIPCSLWPVASHGLSGSTDWTPNVFPSCSLADPSSHLHGSGDLAWLSATSASLLMVGVGEWAGAISGIPKAVWGHIQSSCSTAKP